MAVVAGEHDTESTTYNQPVLRYPTVTGVTVPGGLFEVPLLVTSYMPPDYKLITNNIAVMPAIYSDGTAISTSAVSRGASSLPRVTLEGTIDSPMTTSNATDTTGTSADTLNFMVPTILIGSYKATWTEFIVACMEGRAATTGYGRVDPLWFRDSFGRVYNNPRILDFSASYVEAVPGRTTFSMVLKV